MSSVRQRGWAAGEENEEEGNPATRGSSSGSVGPCTHPLHPIPCIPSPASRPLTPRDTGTVLGKDRDGSRCPPRLHKVHESFWARFVNGPE